MNVRTTTIYRVTEGEVNTGVTEYFEKPYNCADQLSDFREGGVCEVNVSSSEDDLTEDDLLAIEAWETGTGPMPSLRPVLTILAQDKLIPSGQYMIEGS